MVWVRLDEGFPEHRKVLAVGGDAAWLHVCAIAYCNRNETDGVIPRQVIGRLSDRRRVNLLAANLVDVGLWEPHVDGWIIHDYHDYQPSRSQLAKERQQARDRMAEHRRSSPFVRANNERTSPEQTTKFARSSPYPTRPVNRPDDSSSVNPSSKTADCPTATPKMNIENAV